MTVLVVLALLAAWCLLPLPLAVVVGRAFDAGCAPEGGFALPGTPEDRAAAL